MATITSFSTGDVELGKTDSDVWATTHDATTAPPRTTSGNTYVQADRNNGTTTYTIRRCFTYFDISAIDDTATITAATIALISQSDAKGGTGTVFQVYTTTGSDPFDAADFDLVGTTPLADGITQASWAAANNTNTLTLNSTGLAQISKTAKTKFVYREATYDVANSAPPNSTYEYFGFKDSTTAGTSSDPLLTVTYTLPLVCGAGFFALL